jgi:MFS family permease
MQKSCDRPIAAPILLLAFSLALLHMPSGIPAPFYPIYQDTFDLGANMISMFFATYILGVVIALLLVPRILFFNHILVLTCGLSIIGDLALLQSGSVPQIYIGHFIHGIVLGVFTVVIPVVLGRIDFSGESKMAGRLTTSANAVGLTAGPLWSGVMLAYVPSGDTLVWWFQIGMTVLIMPFMKVSLPRTQAQKPDETAERLSRFFKDALTLAATVVGFVAFASGGLLAALGSVLADSVMGVGNAAVQGLVVSLSFALSAVTGAMKLRRGDGATIALGVAFVAAGVFGMALAIVFASLWMFLAAAALTGVGQGFGLQGGTQAVSHRSDANQAGRAISAYFLFCYAGTVLSSFGVGLLIAATDLVTASIAFCVALFAICLVGLWIARRESTRHSRRSVQEIQP